MGYNDRCEISELLGATLLAIKGAEKGSEEIEFHLSDGRRFRMLHNQDCCEGVDVDDVIGDVNDLIGEPITLAEESTNSESHPEGHTFDGYTPESFTWTFYRLATRKGHVDIRWLGESNGYYSEGVDFERVP